MRLDTKQMGMQMDWNLAQFGLGESLSTEVAIIVLVIGLGIASIGPLLAMGGRGEAKNNSGHPLRSKLYTVERISPSSQLPVRPQMKYKTRLKS